MPHKNKKNELKKLIVQYDSSTALFKALALFYAGKDFIGVDVLKNIPPFLGILIDSLPIRLRQFMYSASGWIDAITPKKLEAINSKEIAQWVVEYYPSINYQGVMFGASNGAAIHLAAAMGIPWLPQTYLIATRRLLEPDEIKKDILWGEQAIQPFLHANPSIHVAQMHDPVQDRLMVSKMGYFRIKMLTIEDPFQHFLQQHTNREKPTITIECRYQWPSYRVGQRHTFQLGGLGDVDPYEYLNGSNRIRCFLKRVNSSLTHWTCPKPTVPMPEAEWGFYDSCLNELRDLAKKNSSSLYRLIFDHPEDLSAFVCDLYQWWYQNRTGKASPRMLIENFGIISPRRTLVSRTLPFWLAFNTQSSANLIENYLRQSRPPEEIYLMLMSNGIAEGIGLTSIDHWKRILRVATKKGMFVGVNQNEYPLDFGTFLKYHVDLSKLLPENYALPKFLTIDEVQSFLKNSNGQYKIELKKEF